MQSPRVWGATADEVARRYPCDERSFAHDDAFVRAITIAAPPDLVYRWLCQLRVAPYSYDVLDNFGRRSPPRRDPALEALAPGMRVMTLFRIVAFEWGRTLTIEIASRVGTPLMGAFCGSYDVRANDRGCRLVAKILVRYPPGPYGRLLARAMPTLDLIMFRKQLRTLARYAERDARAAG
ncbi:MAG: hypothetical protein NVS3B17_10060 [Vulcanimicrobiaceae bacterium]